MKHFSAQEHIAATFSACPRCIGGRVMWLNDRHFPVAYFGLTGLCLACGYRAHTQELLEPNDPADHVRDDGSLPDSDRYLAAWNKMMEDDDAA